MELHSNHSQFPPEDQLGPGMAQTFLGCLIPISVEVKGKKWKPDQLFGVIRCIP